VELMAGDASRIRLQYERTPDLAASDRTKPAESPHRNGQAASGHLPPRDRPGQPASVSTNMFRTSVTWSASVAGCQFEVSTGGSTTTSTVPARITGLPFHH